MLPALSLLPPTAPAQPQPAPSGGAGFAAALTALEIASATPDAPRQEAAAPGNTPPTAASEADPLAWLDAAGGEIDMVDAAAPAGSPPPPAEALGLAAVSPASPAATPATPILDGRTPPVSTAPETRHPEPHASAVRTPHPIPPDRADVERAAGSMRPPPLVLADEEDGPETAGRPVPEPGPTPLPTPIGHPLPEPASGHAPIPPSQEARPERPRPEVPDASAAPTRPPRVAAHRMSPLEATPTGGPADASPLPDLPHARSVDDVPAAPVEPARAPQATAGLRPAPSADAPHSVLVEKDDAPQATGTPVDIRPDLSATAGPTTPGTSAQVEPRSAVSDGGDRPRPVRPLGGGPVASMIAMAAPFAPVAYAEARPAPTRPAADTPLVALGTIRRLPAAAHEIEIVEAARAAPNTAPTPRPRTSEPAPQPAPVPQTAPVPATFAPRPEPVAASASAPSADHAVERPTTRDAAALREAAVADPPRPAWTVQPPARVLASGAAAQVFAAELRRGARDARPGPALAPVALEAVQALAPAAPAAASAIDTRLEQWPAAMVERIERMRDDLLAADARVRLAPDALGAVEVSVRREGDAVHVHFAAEQAATRQMLQDAAPRLAEAAEARGLKLGQMGVGVGGSGGGGGQPDQQAGRQGSAPAAPPTPPRARREAPADDHTDTRTA